MRHAFRAFRHPYFRRFFLGQGTSQIGTWLQLIAVSWLVHRLTGSAFMLGLAAFALQLPFLGGNDVELLIVRTQHAQLPPAGLDLQVTAVKANFCRRSQFDQSREVTASRR